MKHTHHNPDYAKNRTASVIKKGSGSTANKDQWEINVNITPAGDNTAWGAFLPRSGKSRPTPYTKINEVDH